VRYWRAISRGVGVAGDGTGVGAVSTTTMALGVGGMAGMFLRGRTIVRDRCRMAAAPGMGAIGDIVLRTIVRRCRRIVRGTAVPDMVSLVIDRVVQPLGIPGIVPEVRVPELRGIVRADREMEIAQEQDPGMEIVLGTAIVQ
jgi:hypothetical protein